MDTALHYQMHLLTMIAFLATRASYQSPPLLGLKNAPLSQQIIKVLAPNWMEKEHVYACQGLSLFLMSVTRVVLLAHKEIVIIMEQIYSALPVKMGYLA